MYLGLTISKPLLLGVYWYSKNYKARNRIVIALTRLNATIVDFNQQMFDKPLIMILISITMRNVISS